MQLSFFEPMDNTTLDENERWGKDSLDLIPTALIGVSHTEIVYCNKYAASLFNESAKNKLISRRLSDFVVSRDRKDLAKFLNNIDDSAEKEKKAVIKFKISPKHTLDLELQQIASPYSSGFTLLSLRDITIDKKKEIIQDTIIEILNADYSGRSIQDFCDHLYNLVFKIMPVKNFYVALYDMETRLISFPYYRDEFSPKPADRKFGNGLTEYVIKSGKPLLLDKTQINYFIDKGYIVSKDVPTTSWLGVSLKTQENFGGAIVIKEYHDENLINKDARDIMEFVSHPISRAIERVIIDEERKKYTEKLQELNRAKDKFFSIISHDLKSPFNSILGFTEILKNQSSALEEGEKAQIFESLYHSTRNTYNLLNNLLQYSKFQAGLVEFDPKAISLLQVVKENINILEGTALKKRIYLKNNLKDDIVVLSDEVMLNSILRNLINNAVKFTRESGEISVGAELMKSYVKVNIKDTGVGMNSETLSNLFIMDTRKSTPGTNKEEGTGLGLLLVKQFVEKNGGQISVKSELNKGSEFSFTLKLFNKYI